MDKCTGCGVCQEKCPSKKIPSEFNRGLGNRTAIYTPFAQAIPNVPVIDRENCIKFKTGKCGVCSKVCQAGAIDYDQQDEIITQKYGAIVVATGFDVIKLDNYDEYAYSQSKDVITSLELERIMNAAGPTKGHLERLSRWKSAKGDGIHPVRWKPVVRTRQRQRATVPRSAVCTPPSMPC